jgi:hypothetical protein
MITGRATAVAAVPPRTLFDTLIRIDDLPSWNDKMTRVVEKPAVLTVGAEWVVEFHVFGRTWQSRSVIDVLDPEARRLVYRSRTDDGNPSEASWNWQVDDEPTGSRVTVSWSLRPVTFWRRTLLGRVRARQLARSEVPASLAALASAAAHAAVPE